MPDDLARLRPGLTLSMIRALAWWAPDGIVHCDVPAPTKAGLVKRGLAQWVAGDDLCPRLTDLGTRMREALLAETPDPTTERAGKP
jgi:hypothetical protein